ncbi:MAG: hypothetical protein K0S65_3918 [Labilithrix sp.]|nr:hypothetical protein [Labilithrix sp.]
MTELSRAVDGLVAAATREVDPRTLKSTVESVLDTFDVSPEAARNGALKTIGRALGKVDGRGAQILSLALGALVEGGASPEVAWPAVSSDLTGLLEGSTAFANAAIEHAHDEHVETAIQSAGAAVAKKLPREGEAWKALPSRCLAAVACLTRSRKLRARVRKDHALVEACWPLSDVIAEVGFLLQALRIVDDETFVVLAPDAGRGWRISVDAMPSNAELYVLLADALVGDPKKGRLPGKRPDPKAVAAIHSGAHPPKGASSVKVPFHLVGWTAAEQDGSLPRGNTRATEHWIYVEGIPADIPTGPAGKERIVLLQDAPYSRAVPVAPSFESLQPSLKIASELSRTDVERTMLKLGKAAAKLRPAPAAPAVAKPSAKKATSKTKAKTKTKTKAKR